ncbi:MAG: hypothetical protein R3E95_15875 [Thiolinea sp.]
MTSASGKARQQSRIESGIREGQLVGWEIDKLRNQQRDIRGKERHYRRSEHCLTRYEYNQLIKQLDQAHRDIRNLKHNNLNRWATTAIIAIITTMTIIAAVVEQYR